MNALELQVGQRFGESVFLMPCPEGMRAFQLKKWVTQNRPQAQVLYCGPLAKLKEWQAALWVVKKGGQYYDYTRSGKPSPRIMPTALDSIRSALDLMGEAPEEILIVRAKPTVYNQR